MYCIDVTTVLILQSVGACSGSLVFHHPFAFLTLIGPLISSKFSTCTTSPFCITSTSPASFFSHTTCRTSSMASLHSDASIARSSSVDNARAISEGQMVLGQALVLNRRWAWRDMIDLLASSRAMVLVQLTTAVLQLTNSMLPTALGLFRRGTGEAASSRCVIEICTARRIVR